MTSDPIKDEIKNKTPEKTLKPKKIIEARTSPQKRHKTQLKKVK